MEYGLVWRGMEDGMHICDVALLGRQAIPRRARSLCSRPELERCMSIVMPRIE